MRCCRLSLGLAGWCVGLRRLPPAPRCLAAGFPAQLPPLGKPAHLDPLARLERVSRAVGFGLRSPWPDVAAERRGARPRNAAARDRRRRRRTHGQDACRAVDDRLAATVRGTGSCVRSFLGPRADSPARVGRDRGAALRPARAGRPALLVFRLPRSLSDPHRRPGERVALVRPTDRSASARSRSNRRRQGRCGLVDPRRHRSGHPRRSRPGVGDRPEGRHGVRRGTSAVLAVRVRHRRGNPLAAPRCGGSSCCSSREASRRLANTCLPSPSRWSSSSSTRSPR